jgi:hypothetical protein
MIKVSYGSIIGKRRVWRMLVPMRKPSVYWGVRQED